MWFLTGTDEHGDRIAQIAAAANVPRWSTPTRSPPSSDRRGIAWGCVYDDYIRTTEARHQKVVQAILQQLWDAGEIYLASTGPLLLRLRAVLHREGDRRRQVPITSRR